MNLAVFTVHTTKRCQKMRAFEMPITCVLDTDGSVRKKYAKEALYTCEKTAYFVNCYICWVNNILLCLATLYINIFLFMYSVARYRIR